MASFLGRALAVAAAGAFVVAGAVVPAHAGNCVKAGGKGVGITAELATVGSTMALKDSIAKNGWKPAGKVKTSCKSDQPLLTTCMSHQRACK